MAFAYPQYREQVQQLAAIPAHVAVPAGNWSQWLKFMVPRRNLGGVYRNRANGHEGLYRVNWNAPDDGVCGIHEWKIVNPHLPGDECVVYLGSSCNAGDAPLRNRILQYCGNRPHKAELINNALREVYELHVRYRVFEGVHQAKNAENYLLGRYNYAWNIRGNGIRAPLG